MPKICLDILRASLDREYVDVVIRQRNLGIFIDILKDSVRMLGGLLNL